MDMILFVASNCDECPKAKQAVESAAKRFKELRARILDMDDRANRLNAVQFKITKPPALVLDGERVFEKRFPTEAELMAFIEQKLKKAGAGKEGERKRWWSVSGLPEQWGAEPER
jgi:thiol-disulfide isomerase/thioredoxin